VLSRRSLRRTSGREAFGVRWCALYAFDSAVLRRPTTARMRFARLVRMQAQHLPTGEYSLTPEPPRAAPIAPALLTSCYLPTLTHAHVRTRMRAPLHVARRASTGSLVPLPFHLCVCAVGSACPRPDLPHSPPGPAGCSGEYLPPRPAGTRSTHTGPLPSAVIGLGAAAGQLDFDAVYIVRLPRPVGCPRRPPAALRR
jgi:hypothetical protein